MIVQPFGDQVPEHGHQQRLQPPDPGRANPPGDPREDLRVDLAPDRGGHLILWGSKSLPGLRAAAMSEGGPVEHDDLPCPFARST